MSGVDVLALLDQEINLANVDPGRSGNSAARLRTARSAVAGLISAVEDMASFQFADAIEGAGKINFALGQFCSRKQALRAALAACKAVQS